MSENDKPPKKRKVQEQKFLDALAEQAEFLDRETAEATLHSKPNFGISDAEPEAELGRRLQEARETAKISQGELSELTKQTDSNKTGISRAVISMYEVGENRPSPRELCADRLY